MMSVKRRNAGLGVPKSRLRKPKLTSDSLKSRMLLPKPRLDGPKASSVPPVSRFDTPKTRRWIYLTIAALYMVMLGVGIPKPSQPGKMALSQNTTDGTLPTESLQITGVTAFNHISKIHQILSGYYSGLSVEEEEVLSRLIYEESLRYGYDPELIVSIIMTESSFYNRAVSHKGAIGLMQLLPMTGREVAEMNRIPFGGAEVLYDPHLNVRLGTYYLALLHKRFGNLELALAAYNNGPTRIASLMHQGIQLPTAYSRKVLNRYKQLMRKPMPVPIPDAGSLDAHLVSADTRI